ncbi:MAG: cytochrome P450 [Pseudomonadota bacterium]
MPTDCAGLRPPGPAQPIALGINEDTLDHIRDVTARYGRVAHVPQPGSRNAVVVSDPELIRQILVKQHTHYRKGRGFERVKMLLGNGLIVSDADIWRRSRTMIQPAFKPRQIHRLTEHMRACAQRRIARWRTVAQQGATLNMTRETSDFALELILISVFGDDVDPETAVAEEGLFAFLAPHAARDLAMVKRVRELRQWIAELVAKRRARNSDDDDFLSMYLDARDKNGEPFSDKALLDEMITLIVAGFETSANTLNWMWYLVAGAPDVEQKMLDDVAQQSATQSSDADAANAMRYTQHVLEETLRLYPPVWLYTRQALQDETLGNFAIGKGTDIYLSPYLVQRDAAHWDRPDTFLPERFERPVGSGVPAAFFPFSLGPRRCIGEYFSFLEMKIHIATLLPKFHFERVNDEAPSCEYAINLRAANDIHLKPHLRETDA